MTGLRLLGDRVLADWTPLRDDGGFRTLWLGQVGSGLGRETSRIAIPLHVYLVTDSAAAIGLVALTQLVAIVLFSLGGGALADALDRRRLMLAAQLAMATTSAGLMATALVSDPSVPVILGLAFVLAALHPLEHPARIASVARTVPPERLTAAIALTSLNFQASSVIGPGVAGVLIAVAGLPAAYGLQAFGFVWAALGSLRLPAMPPLERPASGRLTMIWDGVRFVGHRKLILSTFAMDLNAMIFGLPIALFPVLAIEVFGAGPAEVGLLGAARGAGAFAAALFSGWMPRLRRPGRGVIVAVLIFSLATLLLGLPNLPLAVGVVLIAVGGAADVASAVLRNAIVQSTTPDHLRGRVTALHGLVTNSGPRLGDLRAAVMAELVGAGGALLIGGALAVAGVGAVARAFPGLLAFRVRPETEPRG